MWRCAGAAGMRGLALCCPRASCRAQAAYGVAA